MQKGTVNLGYPFKMGCRDFDSHLDCNQTTQTWNSKTKAKLDEKESLLS